MLILIELFHFTLTKIIKKSIINIPADVVGLIKPKRLPAKIKEIV